MGSLLSLFFDGVALASSDEVAGEERRRRREDQSQGAARERLLRALRGRRRRRGIWAARERVGGCGILMRWRCGEGCLWGRLSGGGFGIRRLRRSLPRSSRAIRAQPSRRTVQKKIKQSKIQLIDYIFQNSEFRCWFRNIIKYLIFYRILIQLKIQQTIYQGEITLFWKSNNCSDNFFRITE